MLFYYAPLGHRDMIINAFFNSKGDKVMTVCKDGAVFEWSWTGIEDEPVTVGNGKWNVEAKHFIHQDNARIQCAAYHRKGNLLVVGFSSGIFGLYETPGVTLIHTLSISQKRINTVAINSTGEWLAFGSAKLGQLLVWEWQRYCIYRTY